MAVNIHHHHFDSFYIVNDQSLVNDDCRVDHDDNPPCYDDHINKLLDDIDCWDAIYNEYVNAVNHEPPVYYHYDSTTSGDRPDGRSGDRLRDRQPV